MGEQIQMPAFAAQQKSLDEAIREMREKVEKGTTCPCCGRLVKLYRRKLHTEMAAFLCRLVRRWRGEHRYYSTRELCPALTKSATDGSYLVLWGLIEREPIPERNDGGGKAGMYRPTERGIAFAEGRLEVASHVHLLCGDVIGFSADQTNVKAAAEQFRIDKWDDQPVHVEVMAEKDAVSGILEPVCRSLDVSFTANRGYSSQSFMYRRGKYLQGKLLEGKKVLVVYLGDHDPSGLDMDRDIEERLRLFAGLDGEFADEGTQYAVEDGASFEVVRIALTRKQITHYAPPPNPAKLTDARAKSYVALHGDESWELDALEPKVLADLVKRAVRSVRDEGLWGLAVEREEQMKDKLKAVVNSLGKEQ